ncbi:MAG TPA: pyrimidine-nucleoside phosphorylase [Bacillota bacterium]|jgi:pyrimidine-nucleoside phosphorylase|nr:pyrimidine-nucleoside phosphorylase [Bacillota bacterium]HOL08540.1 pyrimidine-nucleoside phosphorylase [Bacillota bacterium]HPO96979.1 pyrimidine-nucleoside phosphorylase [Bacillota bacterium]
MRVYDLIWKKREGKELTKAEIDFLIAGYAKGEIPDYQMSAWCMAVYFKGMSFEEATALTLAMVNSGRQVDLSRINGTKVDKHSTGGVGDKTSLVLLPAVAAAGIPVAKMSGRGLGHTGGTLDKLESIPGFKTAIDPEQFFRQVEQIGMVLAGQTADLVPADKKLYALRDLTATVESIPLIASSIVSKKLASGADAVVLDVKYGDGAFMNQYQAALELAQTMVEIGNRSGRRFKAVLSSMEQPLGMAIGNSLEVAEAITTLKGNGPADLTELCTVLGGVMLWLAGKADTIDAGSEIISEIIYSGKGLQKFQEFVQAQGGNSLVVDEPDLLPRAKVIKKVIADQEGWVERISCRELGLISMRLGSGRTKLEDVIYPEVGIVINKKVGDYIKAGEVIAEIHALTETAADLATTEIRDCYLLTQQPVAKPELIKAII